MADDFTIGDTVALKSGSPNMTVTQIGEVYGTPTVWTVWFDKTKKFTGDFPPETLRKVTVSQSTIDLI
ncbi:MAG: YodC family protein [Sphingomonas pseudosanguinis]|uniref:YodC family protein n=1 Tax=Sphingomonas pseudosanguinis TaxID=413712 RepID=UPI0039188203